jgi:UDP-N-acetylmuramyl pentapeptide synthase
MKKRFYFVLASYFKFWARLQLRRWKPKIFVITGSSGKTTTLHLVEAQLGAKARYSHHANSAYGVCFDILGLARKRFAKSEWIGLICSAPFKAFKKPFTQNIYIVEVDCDRPQEGEFLASLLRPNGVVWLSSTQTHAMNFDKLVTSGQFDTVESAIAHEYGYLVEAACDFVVVNIGNPGITEQLDRTQTDVFKLSEQAIVGYEPTLHETRFQFDKQQGLPRHVSIPELVPQEIGLSILATAILATKLAIQFDNSFRDFVLPPGRSSVFEGIKQTTLIDSTYNASLDAAEAMLSMYAKLSVKTKWLVVSDILEQGANEQQVHEQLAAAIATVKADKIVVMGPRTKKYTSPALDDLGVKHVSLESPRQVLDLLQQSIRGNETILFKGTRFMEGVIEHLLANSADADKLCRREPIWEKRRKAWGL